MGVSGMRNLFEDNKPEVSQEDALMFGDKLHTILPSLTEGQRYELVKLSNGRTAVVVEKNG